MFTNAPGSQRSCSEHKWADRGLSPRNRGMSGLLDLSVRHSIFPGHSSTSWAPTRSPVTRWLCHRYPAACHGAERQAEHHKFCVYSQKRLIPVSAGNTQHMQGELPLQQAHPSQISPLGWQRHPGLPPVPAQSQGQDTCVKEQAPQAHPCSHLHRRATRVPPAWSPPCQRCYCPTVSPVLSEQLRVPKGQHWMSNQLLSQKYSAGHSMTTSDVSCPEP